MRRVHIAAGEGYDVLIGHGILQQAGREAAKLIKPCRAMIVSEEKIFALYGETLQRSLEQAGFTVFRFSMPAARMPRALTCSANCKTRCVRAASAAPMRSLPSAAE